METQMETQDEFKENLENLKNDPTFHWYSDRINGIRYHFWYWRDRLCTDYSGEDDEYKDYFWCWEVWKEDIYENKNFKIASGEEVFLYGSDPKLIDIAQLFAKHMLSISFCLASQTDSKPFNHR